MAGRRTDTRPQKLGVLNLAAARATLAFDAFAAAGADGDGKVTLGELGGMSLSEVSISARYEDARREWKTRKQYVYPGLFPLVAQYQGDGACAEIEIFPNDRDPH